MSSKAIKQLGKETAVYGLSTIIARFLSFLLTPFYAQVFSPAEFGLVSVFFSMIAVASVVYPLSLHSGYLRFASDADEQSRPSLFSKLFFLIAFISVLFSFLFMEGKSILISWFQLPNAVEPIFFWMILILTFDALASLPFIHLRLIRNSLHFSMLKLLNVALTILFTWIFLIVYPMGMVGVFIANAISSGVICLILFIMSAHLLTVKFSASTDKLSNIFAYSFPLIPTAFGTMVNEIADRLFIQRLSQEQIEKIYPIAGYTAETLTGLYSFSHKMGIVMLLVVSMFAMAWSPFYLAEYKKEKAPALFSTVFRLYLLGLLSVGLFAIYFVDWFGTLSFFGIQLIPTAYQPGLIILPLIVLAYIFNGIHVFFAIGPQITKRTKEIVWMVMAGVFVTIFGNLLLLPLFGIVGSATTTLLCYATIGGLMMWRSQVLYPIPIEKTLIYKLIILSLPFWLIGGFHFAMSPVPIWMRFLLFALYLISIFATRIITIQQLNQVFKRTP